jgi:sulfatase modifying factor 1
MNRRPVSILLVGALLGGCRRDHGEKDGAFTDEPVASTSGAFGPPEPAPPPRRGMVWVPGGALVAGTPPQSLPRIADEEMPGEQVILGGFYIDVYAYPNEDGAIPLTNVTQAEATRLCEEQGKRLCTELEWERACKGPDNLPYEYGERYDPKRCMTGTLPMLRPSGIHVGCRSAFGVSDLHGGAWEWTASAWERGGEEGLVTVRGGNATAGELVGRCANAMGRPPQQQSGIVGFRCCGGPRNEAEVNLQVKRGKGLEARERVDQRIVEQIASRLGQLAGDDLSKPDDFHFERMWVWRPIGNEELVVLGGCAGIGRQPACGIVVARVILDQATPLAWASSGHWVPNVHVDREPRDLWLFGGDELGSFRRLVGYVWGRVSVGVKERRVPRPKKKPRG